MGTHLIFLLEQEDCILAVSEQKIASTLLTSPELSALLKKTVRDTTKAWTIQSPDTLASIWPLLADQEWQTTPTSTNNYTLQSQKYVYSQGLLYFRKRVLHTLTAMHARNRWRTASRPDRREAQKQSEHDMVFYHWWELFIIEESICKYWIDILLQQNIPGLASLKKRKYLKYDPGTIDACYLTVQKAVKKKYLWNWEASLGTMMRYMFRHASESTGFCRVFPIY